MHGVFHGTIREPWTMDRRLAIAIVVTDIYHSVGIVLAFTVGICSLNGAFLILRRVVRRYLLDGYSQWDF